MALQRENSPLYGQGLSQSQLHLPLFVFLKGEICFLPQSCLFIASPDENCHIPFPLRLSDICWLDT